MAKTILAVDDSSSLRQMVAFSLKAAGYQVVEAVDGQDGLDKAKQQTVDLVLTDQNMPRMDGLTLIKSHHRVLGRDETERPRRRRQRLAGQALRPATPDRGGQESDRLTRA
jgi:two-component system chemotaxis response regulator CheY